MLIITIHNEGGTNESSSYTYVVSVNREVIASGEIKGHDRRKGWCNLVEMMLKQNDIEQIKRDWCGE
jgi:hypothetical protein